MNERLDKLVYTLTAMPGVKAVSLMLQGRLVRVLSGEGMILHQPLMRLTFGEFAR